jgi:hypothetical protein
MSFRDQKKYLEALKKYENRLDWKEIEEYKIFLKRDKDEEEFDTVSMKRLKDIHDKYFVAPDRSKLEALFRKKEE